MNKIDSLTNTLQGALADLQGFKTDRLLARMTNSVHTKHKLKVNAFVRANLAYDVQVDRNDILDGFGCQQETSKQEKAYDKASDLWHELPKREQANLNRTHDGMLTGSY